MSPIGINLRKLSTGAQLQTFPYPTALNAGRLYSTFWSNVVAPMGVKFGMQHGSSMPNFTPIGATCRPCQAKNLKIGL